MSAKYTLLEIDVAIIGGGPAGMMAAGRAAELGARVALIEKNARTGRKLLLTGNGRCNLTNSGHDIRGLVAKYGPNGKFLYQAFSRFGVPETLDFFHGRGLKTITEDGGRVFPASERAADVLRVLMDYMKEGGVRVITEAAVEGIETEDGRVSGAILPDGVIRAASFVLCTGGKSYPKTGSTGEAFGWLKDFGHDVVPPAPALAPVTVKEGWVRDMEGASLADVGAAVLLSGRKKAQFRGDAVVTASGLSGPMVLDMSGRVRELMKEGEVTLALDLMPDTDAGELDEEILRAFTDSPNRLAGNMIAGFVAPRLAGTFLRLSGIDPGMRVNRVSRDARMRLAGLIKGLPFTVKGTGGFERAIVTSGGVALKETDPATMRSRLAGNLYFAGEVIDIDGPTGGYNLQVCWSTGFAAGENAGRAALSR